MNVIFLDIDGVLNSAQTKTPRRFPYIVEPQLLERLNGLRARTGAEIGLSSTWRHDPVGLLAAKYYGIPLIDWTLDLTEHPRRDEILAWLSEHPEVERFIVIDDEDDEPDALPLFQPHSRVGLDSATATQAEAYLKGETKRDARRPRLVRFAQNFAAIFHDHKG